MKVLAYIPARGGSKGVPGKNIRPLAGKPLIAHTILSAKKARVFDRLFVSTDAPAIARAAARWGARAPWLRPGGLARDNSLLPDAIAYDLERLKREEGYVPDALMVLQPTSPFRAPEAIKKALALFKRSKGRTVISITPARSHPNWCFTIDKRTGSLKRLFNGAFVARQHLPAAYCLDGSIFLIATKTFLRDRSFYGKPALPLVVPPKEAVDIDTLFDFDLAEGLARKRSSR